MIRKKGRKSNISHSHFQGTVNEILLNSLDILTFVVPPILPAALTANNAFAQKRLQKKGIYCLHSKHICLCGGIDIVAFDKVICSRDDGFHASTVCILCKTRFRDHVSCYGYEFTQHSLFAEL